MSSRAKSISKRVTSKDEVFINEMTNNILGSFLISLYILKATDKTPNELTKFYKQEKKRWLKNKVDEKTWMQDIVDKLNEVVVDTEDGHFIDHKDTTYIPYGKIGLVVGAYNRLVAPIIENKDGELIPLSLRRDGWRGVTLTSGQVFEIEEEVEYEIKDEEDGEK